jgi:hypothetical protein
MATLPKLGKYAGSYTLQNSFDDGIMRVNQSWRRKLLHAVSFSPSTERKFFAEICKSEWAF